MAAVEHVPHLERALLSTLTPADGASSLRPQEPHDAALCRDGYSAESFFELEGKANSNLCTRVHEPGFPTRILLKLRAG